MRSVQYPSVNDQENGLSNQTQLNGMIGNAVKKPNALQNYHYNPKTKLEAVFFYNAVIQQQIYEQSDNLIDKVQSSIECCNPHINKI